MKGLKGSEEMQIRKLKLFKITFPSQNHPPVYGHGNTLHQQCVNGKNHHKKSCFPKFYLKKFP